MIRGRDDVWLCCRDSVSSAARPSAVTSKGPPIGRNLVGRLSARTAIQAESVEEP